MFDRKLLFACLLGALPFIVVALFTEARGWALIALVGLVVMIALASSGAEERRPELADTRGFLSAHLNQLGFAGSFHLEKLQHRFKPGSSSDCVTVQFQATLTFDEPLFQTTVPPTEQCGGFTPRRLAALTTIAEQLGPALANKPGVRTPFVPPDPYARQYITARTAETWSVPISGAALATHSPQLGWSYAMTATPREFDRLIQTGRPKSAFPEAIDISSASGQEWLSNTLAAWAAFETELGRLRLLADEHRVERSRAALAEFFQACSVGTSFAGTGETLTHQNAPLPFVLDISAIDAARHCVQFFLRKDRTSPLKRGFEATIEHDAVSGLIRLNARTPAIAAVPNGGPLLSASATFQLEFVWSPANPTRLDGRGADFVFTLHAGAPDAIVVAGLRELTKNHHDDREREVWKAITPGTTYVGTFTADGRDQHLTLSFGPAAETGSVTARVECASWSGWFDVTRCPVDARRGAYDLMLEPQPVRVAAGGADRAEAEPWERLFLQLDDNGLVGVAEHGATSMPVALYR